ncbi:type VI secretion system-associated FHA domain protein [Caenimonas sp. SL110]|uniref:type VI secretion system-associated FHA domain protein n=1 Tax=Caenimonas sp. SL110 TaxID=1450524 RepID=UPI000653A1A9|nr:type VI secretion system-associated FHA domain protein [Caenimonas sp. SL110]
MTLEIHIAGPGLDVVRTLEAGQDPLVLGRDADCGICLPDPERNVSRRHLAVWCENHTLVFHVLSVVNGVEMPFGEAPPGARGVLPFGQTMKVGDYALDVRLVATPASTQPEPEPAPDADPWAVFDREGSGATMPVASAPRASMASSANEDDPFGEWGFESTFGPGQDGGGPLDATKLAAGDVSSIFKGLGLDPSTLGSLSQGELETIGRLVRILVLGVMELHSSVIGVKHEMRSGDRTMVATKDNNPLKSDWPQETKLRYLFGGRAAGVGFANPERALRELFVELIAHNTASSSATRAAIAGTLKEFEPEALKERLLGGGPKILEGVRAWDAFSKYYGEQGEDMSKWTQLLLDRYFTDAYLRESLRIRRETPPRER